MISDYITIAEASCLIKKREISSVELLQSKLQRIEKFDGQFNSFINVLSEHALATAKKLDNEIASGHYRGLLHGIPIGLKDVYNFAGVPTTAQSKILQNNIPSLDAFSVKRLKEEGAIIVGKLATHEFALGGPSFDLPWPPARNPWDSTRFTGGSSSGSGAAVAAGFVLGSAAGDTGGSIRTPAAYCGLTGFKPSYGLISRNGILPLAWSLESAGPIAWTAEDCAILLEGMAGFDPQDPTSVRYTIPDYHSALTNDVKGLRIGLLRHFYNNDNPVSIETRDAIDSAAKKFEELGCEVQEINLSPLAEWNACGMIIMLAESYAIHEANLQERFMDYGEVFRDRMAIAGLFTSSDYIQAMRRRRELIKEFNECMRNFDVILTAVTATEAPKIDKVGKFSILEKPLLTIAFNVTGSPAISVCCGFGSNGLPLAMQIVGKRFDDAIVLRVADAYERANSWGEKRPILLDKAINSMESSAI